LLARRLVALGNAIRRLDGVDLEEVASTRLLVYAALLIRGGLPVLAACRAALVEALSDDAEVTAGLEELVRTVLGE
jgi:nitric oxide reductase NorQ protein